MVLKALLMAAVVGLLVWKLVGLLRGRGASPEVPPPAPGPERVPQAMLTCAHCGVHLPATDAVREADAVYCCEAHRRQGRSPGP